MKTLTKALTALLLTAAFTAPAVQAAEVERSPWEFQISGISHHFEQPRAKNREWNERNVGLGIQYDIFRSVDSRWTGVATAGTLKDSFGGHGGYVGGSMVYRLNDDRVQVNAGAGALLFYRAHNWKQEMGFVPAVMPRISIEDTETGLGLNILAAPKVTIGSRKAVPFVFVQGTMRF